ncbi:MAG: DNA strand exchange inhibitor protein [bacterium]|nr:DNA strand exchange inhibitor protein [bacterium]
MDDATLAKLQFDNITDTLASLCACSLGKGLARRVRPARSPKQVTYWLAQVSELLVAEEAHGLPPMGGVFDIRADVHACACPAGLDEESLARVQQTLAATGPLRRWLLSLGPRAPLLASMEARVVDFTALAATIGEQIDSRGRVRDSASPRLASLRRAIEQAREQIRVVVKRILKQPRFVRLLQYANPTFHDDRIVLPLKAEHRGRLPGIVHRSSDSGSTLFVEPAEAVELNNSIVRLRSEEHEEVTRILAGLSRLVHQNTEGVLHTIDTFAVLDLVAAKVRYAHRCDARCPMISDDGKLDLHGARHPVLVDLHATAAREGRSVEPVVPIDLRVGDDFDLLVITGPNTGGKTVTLKTVGLLAAMTQAGIPIPVDEGTTLPVYRHIMLDVGDEQSLEQSLSTFSSHLSNILSMLERAGRGTLVLIDELGAGTDPDEGAAIGQAIMDELLDRECSAVVTTHLSQLKAVAFSRKRVDNASVEFDLASLKPTYHVRIGEPGNSNAISIAERLGMPKGMVTRARSHLVDRHRALSRAIEGTLHSRRQAEEARKAARKAMLEADESRTRFERETHQLEQARVAHERWMAWLTELRPGDEVYVETFGKPARVVRMQLHKQTALLSAGSMDIEVELSSLSRPRDDTAGRSAG